MKGLCNNKVVGDFSGLCDMGNGDNLYIQKILELDHLKTNGDPERYVGYRVTGTSNGEKAVICYLTNGHFVSSEKFFNEDNIALVELCERSGISPKDLIDGVKELFID